MTTRFSLAFADVGGGGGGGGGDIINIINVSGDNGGPFPDDNVIISETGGGLLDPAKGGTYDVIIGNLAMEKSVSGRATVAVGRNAAENYGQKSDIADSSLWTGANWAVSVSTGSATHTPGATTPLRQLAPLNQEQPYTLTYTVSGRSAGTIQPRFGDGTPSVNNTGTIRSSNGTFNHSFRPVAGDIALEFVPSSDFNGTISAVALVTLTGTSSVMVGFVNSQFVGETSAHTSVGAYCSQGQETDPDTGLDISGTNKLFGVSGCHFGEANAIHIRGKAGGNCSYGFASTFDLTTGSQNCTYGIVSGAALTTENYLCAYGASSYRYGRGGLNAFFGAFSGQGAVASTTLSGPCSVGDKTFSVVDASLFAVGGNVVSTALLPPDTKVVSIDLPSSTITLDKASWNTITGNNAPTYLYSIQVASIGTYNAAVGYLSMFKLSGAAARNWAGGASAGENLTTGSRNTFDGCDSGSDTTTGSDNICIGELTQTSGATVSKELNIGNTIFATGLKTATSKVGIGNLLRAPAQTLDVAGDLGINSSVVIDTNRIVRKRAYTVATVPAASVAAGAEIYVSNESGGAVPAFSDGTNWRRVTDRAVVT